LSKLVSKLETGNRILDKNDPPLAGFVRNPALLGRVSKTSVDTSIDNLKLPWIGRGDFAKKKMLNSREVSNNILKKG